MDKNRIFHFKIISVILFVLIFIYLISYCVFDVKHLKNKPNEASDSKDAKDTKGITLVIEPIKPTRGNFFDRNGKALTQNREVCTIKFNKAFDVYVKFGEKQIEKKCPVTAEILIKNLMAKELDKDPQKLYDYIYSKDNDVMVLAKHADIKYAERLAKLNYNGIIIDKTMIRSYPEGPLASRVMGYVSKYGDPITGFEKYLSKFTEGEPGSCEVLKDSEKNVIRRTQLPGQEKKDGDNVYLTLDVQIQYYAEKALSDMAEKYKPDKAMCIVMDPKTSEILACANYPNFDPNIVSNYPLSVTKNFAVEDAYEPGSTLKPITVAMALEKGYDINYSFGKCTNVCQVGRRSSFKCDHGPHGTCSPKNIISHSCNIGAWFIAKKLGKNMLYDYLKNFGIVGRPGKEFHYEARGSICNDVEDLVPIEIANISFGQGVQTSCLAMCNAYCAFANGGVYHTPKIIKSIKDPDGKVVQSMSKDKGKRIISEETAKKMTDCLVACVNEGTGKPAKIDGIQTAGKTGSAQKLINGTYKSGCYDVSFMGYAPANNPKLVVAVLVSNPKGSSYGAVVACPVWKQTMEKSLKYLKAY